MGLIYYKGKTYGGDSSGGGVDSAEKLEVLRGRGYTFYNQFTSRNI